MKVSLLITSLFIPIHRSRGFDCGNQRPTKAQNGVGSKKTLVEPVSSKKRNLIFLRMRDMDGDNDENSTIRPSASSRSKNTSRSSHLRAQTPNVEEGAVSSSTNLPSFSSSEAWYDIILEDGSGHVNGMLAERIFQWEQELRQKQNLPRVDYSIRSGLRLVEELVQQILHEKGQRGMIELGAAGSKSKLQHSLYSDLVQEGLIALLDVMQGYRADKTKHRSTENNSNNHYADDGFARYARKEIRQRLDKSWSSNLSNRPVRLPQSVTNIVGKAKKIARAIIEENTVKATNDTSLRPTVEQVAERLHIPAEQLRDQLVLFKRMRPPALSVESTHQITHPLLDDSVLFQDWEDWEKTMEGMMTTNKKSSTMMTTLPSSSSGAGDMIENTFDTQSDDLAFSSRQSTASVKEESTISEYYLDNPDLQDLEGDDQAWVLQQEATFGAGILSDVIPDVDELSPDDLALQEMIKHDVTEFLSSTLTETEHKVIRSIFGLDTGKQSTLKRTAEQLNLTAEQVAMLLAGGLQKLRESYTKHYVEPYLESGDFSPGRIVDSV